MPNLKLSDKAVERLAFSEKRITYFDTRIPGFCVRVGIRSKVYMVRGRAGNKHFKVTLGKVGVIEFDEARDKAEAISRAAAKGISPADLEKNDVVQPAQFVSLKLVLSEFLKARKSLSERTRKEYGQILQHNVPDWLEIPMASISPDMVLVKHAEIGANSPAGADYVFRVIRALFNYAMEVYENDVGRNPVRRLASVRAWYKVPRRKTFVKPTQLPVFFACLRDNPGMIADYLEVLLFTGIRSASEIAAITISQVDLKEESINLKVKGGKDHYVPIVGSAVAVLKRRIAEAEKAGSEFVFYSLGSKKGFINTRGGKQIAAIRALFKDTELSGFTPHDLRRSFLSYADDLGIGQAVQKCLVGHAVSQDVTDGYKVLTIERLRKEVRRIERFIMRHGK